MADVITVLKNRTVSVFPFGPELLTGAAIAQAAGLIASMRGRAGLYGEENAVRADLFVSDTTEAAFSEGYYREGYELLTEPADLTGWEFSGGTPVITSAGLAANDEDGSASIAFSPTGDFTLMVEADISASTGVNQVIAAIVGSVSEHRIVLYRTGTNVYALQVYDGTTQTVVPGEMDATARRVRVAVSSEAGQTRACFDGGEILVVSTPQPAGLIRANLGLFSLGFGDELMGFIRTALIRHRASSDVELRRMTLPWDELVSPSPSTSNSQTISLIEQALITHGNDQQPHELPSLRRTADLADSKTGLWSAVATDTFTGADGALTTTETGAKTWVALGGNAIHRIGGKAASPDSALRGTAFLTGFADGQLEADLDPGTMEASLYFRWSAIGNHLMVQRKPDGSMALMKFVGGTVTLLTQVVYRAYVAGERWKIRMVGPRIWVYRIASGVEELIYDVVETQWQSNTGAGIRLDGTGTADNFRYLGREAL